MKTCKTCKESKPLNDYHAHKKGVMGRRSSCKECRRIEQANYRATRSESAEARVREQQKKWRDNNKDKLRAYYKKYKNESGDHYKPMNRRGSTKWKKENREKVKTLNRKYHVTSREKLTDGYIRKKIYRQSGQNLHAGDIPKELVETTRFQIEIQRIIQKKIQ